MNLRIKFRNRFLYYYIIGQCTCGTTCWTGSTQGVCLEDNNTCGQPFNTPFCPGGINYLLYYCIIDAI